MLVRKSVYLCGSMSGLKSYGLGWRRDIEKWLTDRGVPVFNPCIYEASIAKKYAITVAMHEWEKLPQDFQEEIIARDINQLVKRTSFVVCYFTQYSTGTVSELTIAGVHNIPIYFITNRKLKGWPGTYAGKAGNRVFKTKEQFYNYIAYKYKLRKVKKS